jgi:hypothetical protein
MSEEDDLEFLNHGSLAHLAARLRDAEVIIDQITQQCSLLRRSSSKRLMSSQSMQPTDSLHLEEL